MAKKRRTRSTKIVYQAKNEIIRLNKIVDCVLGDIKETIDGMKKDNNKTEYIEGIDYGVVEYRYLYVHELRNRIKYLKNVVRKKGKGVTIYRSIIKGK